MKKIEEQKGLPEKKSTDNSWNNRRKLIDRNIQLEIDLEKREIRITTAASEIPVKLATTNVDSFISNHVHAKDSQAVIESLEQAQRGVEAPIKFNFVHPKVPMLLQFEYHYQIVYARYSQTKLQGTLVRSSKRGKQKL